MTQTCPITGRQFEISELEQRILNQLGLPFPTTYIDLRHQRRFAFRNERSLYHNVCALSGQKTLSIYAPSSPFKVYSVDSWHSDKWDFRDYGRDYDFNRPFFEQFKELELATPKLALMHTSSENSDYCNLVTHSNNCYLCFGIDYDQDCLYCYLTFHCQNVLDSFFAEKCELCYECVNCENSYNLKYSQNSSNCQDSSFLYDCKNCQNCLACYGLRNQEYCIYNVKHSKEEYEKKLLEAQLNTRSGRDKLAKEFDSFQLKFPHRATTKNNCENCTGDNLDSCNNCHNLFDSFQSQDNKDVIFSANLNDTVSCSHIGHKTQLSYEVISAIESSHCFFSIYTWTTNNIFYSNTVFNSSYLFGCSNVSRGQYCILNKQYTKEEYFELVPKIIEHMQSTGEWGQFFPASHSAFPYNDTLAQEYFPLTKEQALQQGYQWKDKDQREYQSGTYIPADNIHDIEDSITNEVLSCSDCGKNFKITPTELQFYKQLQIPIPTKCPDSRHYHRLNKRNKLHLRPAICAKTGEQIQTSYPEDTPYIVYSEQAYQNFIYGN